MEAVAKLRNNPTSTRKMRLLADLIRGMEVEKALNTLKFHPKHPSVPLEKLLLSAINNWEQKNEGSRVEEAGLIVKRIFVDGGTSLKRLRPAPQGRAYRVSKRSNHVTIVVDSKVPEAPVAEAAPQEAEAAPAPEKAAAKPRTRKAAAKTEEAAAPKARKAAKATKA